MLSKDAIIVKKRREVGMMAFIDKDTTTCKEFQDALEKNENHICEIMKKSLPKNSRGNNAEAKRMIVHMLLIKEDEIQDVPDLESEKIGSDSSKKTTDKTGNYLNSDRNKKFKQYGIDDEDRAFDRSSLHNNDGAKQLFGFLDGNEEFLNKVKDGNALYHNNKTYNNSINAFVKNKLANELNMDGDSIVDDDSINKRLQKLQAVFKRKIEDEIDDEALRDVMLENSQTNIEKFCEEILSEINRGVEEMTSQTKNTYDDVKEKITGMIDKGITQIILTGAPGTGKTKMAVDIVEDQCECGKAGEIKNSKGEYQKYEFVQFHPSYDYTDFVEGLRPVEVEVKKAAGLNRDDKPVNYPTKEITFKKVDGIFKQFCRDVIEKGDENKKYFFIIDEINRADLSKVFGELMYCLETDKRGEPIKTQYQNLPTYDIEKGDLTQEEDVFSNGFYIPKNVIVIGTMNDIDRSVESMDFALRRRFVWYEVKVSKGLLKSAFSHMMLNVKKDKEDIEKNVEDNIADKLAERVTALNKIIEGKKEYGLNEHYAISQGQFANLPKEEWEKLIQNNDPEKKLEEAIKDFLTYVWDYRIELLLREYVRGEDGIDGFIDDCRKSLKIVEEQKSEMEHASDNKENQ